MPFGITRLWCSYFEGVGTPLRLIIEPYGKGGPPVLHPDIDGIAEPAFRQTLTLAFTQTLANVGWPALASFRINLEPIDPAYPLPPSLDGDSHFGTMAIGLAQAVGRAEPSCVKYAARPLLPILQATCLDRVAVAAAYAQCTGHFSPVGCIGNKLDSFCLPDLEGPVVCVVSLDEDLNHRCQPAGDAAGQTHRSRYYPRNGRPFLPIVRAYDAIDAIIHLWEAQARNLPEHI